MERLYGKKQQHPRDEPGRYAYDGLDRVLHEKARLGIMTSLVTRPEGAVFNELKRLCALTDGNLSRHVDVLQEAGPRRSLARHRRRTAADALSPLAGGARALRRLSRGARAGGPRRAAEGGQASRARARSAAGIPAGVAVFQGLSSGLLKFRSLSLAWRITRRPAASPDARGRCRPRRS